MEKNKNQIIQYLNSCGNCYGTVVDNSGNCEVVYIKAWHVFDNRILIAIDCGKKEIFKKIVNSNIAFAIWDKMEGYQIKGRMIDGDVMEGHKDLLSKGNLLATITDIYSVTPGKQAGKHLYHQSL